MSSELNKVIPLGWEVIIIGEITVPYETCQPAKEPETEFKYIDIGSIDNSTYTITNPKTFFGKDAPSRARRIVKKGDILFSTVRTYLKNIARVPVELDGVLTSTGIAVLRSASEIDSNFLFYFVLSDNFIRKISSTMDGTLYPAVTDNDVASAEIALPPLNEQRRIVAKIDALRARSQRVKEALEAIPPLLDQFRRSVLAAAFRGDLTADWREKNSNVEPASVLLERIRAERDKRYEQGCKKAVVEARKKPILFKENLEPVELSNLPIIPDTWCWERLVNISNIVGGVTKGRKFGNRKTIMLPYLRVANVQDGFLDLDEIKEIETLPEDLEKYHLEYGDILFTEGGDRDKLGRGTVWRNNIEKCVHQNHVYRARLYYLGVSCEYISLATKSEYAKAYFFANASQTVNLASINITSLGNLPLPMPVEEEQKEIVYRVQTLFKFADKIAQQYQEVKVQLDQLDQSILAKAFRGELVSQDPNDEPASLLLGCIRSERNKLEASTKTAKKSTGNTGERRSRKAKQDAKSVQLELPILE